MAIIMPGERLRGCGIRRSSWKKRKEHVNLLKWIPSEYRKFAVCFFVQIIGMIFDMVIGFRVNYTCLTTIIWVDLTLFSPSVRDQINQELHNVNIPFRSLILTSIFIVKSLGEFQCLRVYLTYSREHSFLVDIFILANKNLKYKLLIKSEKNNWKTNNY